VRPQLRAVSVISAASATPVWSFQSHASAAGFDAKRVWKASGRPARSTGSGVLPVVSTPTPMTFDGENPRPAFVAARSARRIVTSAPFT
jgi:hypothetical protein